MDDRRQERVIGYSAEILRVVSGLPVDETATAMTISVAAIIIAWTHDSKERAEMMKTFGKQLRGVLERDDVVDWIKAHTTYASPSETRQ